MIFADIVRMKNLTRTIAWTIFLLFLSGTAVTAVDLSKYQGFMQSPKGYLEPATRPTARRNNTFGSVTSSGNNQPQASYQEADAAYRHQTLVTLGKEKKRYESLSVPPDTRIPEGLRPLLSDRTHPREGLSMNGLTGSFLIPSPGVLESGKGGLAVHVMPFDLYDVNDNRYTDEAYFQSNVKLAFGAFEGFEIGVDRDFSNQDRFDVPEPTYLNMKYQVPGKVTLGGNFCTDSQGGYHSVWATAGVPAVWVGVGANFGATSYQFTYSGRDRLARAKLGGYNYDYNSAEGYADPVFFLVGGAVPMTNSTAFVYDFNGDKFSLGFRLNYQKIVFFDAGFVSDGDYERLPGAVAHKRIRNFVFGGSLVF
jgi:hypothetical protein